MQRLLDGVADACAACGVRRLLDAGIACFHQAEHTAALSCLGHVFSWGSNSHGQLGQ